VEAVSKEKELDERQTFLVEKLKQHCERSLKKTERSNRLLIKKKTIGNRRIFQEALILNVLLYATNYTWVSL
jgi:hypothetical protein